MVNLLDPNRSVGIRLQQGSGNELLIVELKCGCCDKKYIVFSGKGEIHLSLEDTKRLAKQIRELTLIAASKP